MHIDKNKDYIVGDFKFRNFINLSSEEKLMILKERNHPDVKKWMFTQDDIKEEDHIRFIESLANREDVFYWLIEKDDYPIGVLNLIKCDYSKNEGESGYYLFADYQACGYGLDLHHAYKTLFFGTFGLENMPGHTQVGNTAAYMMSVFFGAVEDGLIEKDGKSYYKLNTKREDFFRIDDENLTQDFVKFLKTRSRKNTQKK